MEEVNSSLYTARIPTNKGKAFQRQSSECILLGYADDAKAYQMMEISTKRCFIERSVQLNEDLLHDLQPTEEEGIITQSIPFVDDDVLTNILDSVLEDEDQDDQDLDIENESQQNLDPN